MNLFVLQGGDNMKITLKKGIPILLTALITLIITLIIIACMLRPKILAIHDINLNQIKDGEYTGICQNKILFAVVKVHVQNHVITNIDILEHKQSYMKQAIQIGNEVVKQQTLDVDTISGATLTSTTVLKAVENALQ